MSEPRPSWATNEVDLSRPNAARVYDYYLGGAHNFAVDRELARRAIAAMPELPWMMQINRAFLRRAVRFLAGQGIRQFIDLGSGIPTEGNVHEVAQRQAPDARVVYVEREPVAVSHSRRMLAGNDRVAVVHADLRYPDVVLAQPELERLLDLSQPVAVLLFAVLHFVPDTDDPRGIVARYRERMAPGSYLALSHGTHEQGDQRAAEVHQLYKRSGDPLIQRGREEVAALLEGFELVQPGVVYVPEWRPDRDDSEMSDPARSKCFGAVGRLP